MLQDLISFIVLVFELWLGLLDKWYECHKLALWVTLVLRTFLFSPMIMEIRVLVRYSQGKKECVLFAPWLAVEWAHFGQTGFLVSLWSLFTTTPYSKRHRSVVHLLTNISLHENFISLSLDPLEQFWSMLTFILNLYFLCFWHTPLDGSFQVTNLGVVVTGGILQSKDLKCDFCCMLCISEYPVA